MLVSIAKEYRRSEVAVPPTRPLILLAAGRADRGHLRAFLPDAELRVVEDVRSAVSLASRGTFDLVVLGTGMEIECLELLRMVRAHCESLVIVLSGSGPAERIAALQLGADDCLSMPCNLQEFGARVQGLLRRHRRVAESPLPIEIGRVRVDPGSRTVWVDGCTIELTSTEYTVLETLIRAAGCTVSRRRIAWLLHQHESTGFDRTLDVHVTRLRRKLGKPSPIRTVRGEGYFFCSGPAAP
jgi:two-component system OmpR family response regulator